VTWLADHCPRLARAQEAARRFAGYDRAIERSRTTALLEAQRVLAHRELQLIRAMATNDAGYIAERARKLDASRRRVAALSQRQVVA
jgi:predicted transcriptional regulator